MGRAFQLGLFFVGSDFWVNHGPQVKPMTKYYTPHAGKSFSTKLGSLVS